MTEAAWELFNSQAIDEHGDVLFVWDDVLAITPDCLGKMVDEHRCHKDKDIAIQAFEPLEEPHFRRGKMGGEKTLIQNTT